MTIECEEYLFWGLFKKRREIQSGNEEELETLKSFIKHPTQDELVSRSIYVESPDTIVVRYKNIFNATTEEFRYHQEEINSVRITDISNKVLDIIFGHRRRYTWRQG